MADDLRALIARRLNGEDDSSDSDDINGDIEDGFIDDDDEIDNDDNEEVNDESEEQRSEETPTTYAGAARKPHITVSFDKSLPSTHSYLGNDMEDVQSGRTIHDDESFVTIPLYMLPGIVLIPDQIIPLHLFQHHQVAMMKRVAENDKTFGIMTYRDVNNTDNELECYGTTAEIFSIKDETDDITGISTLRIKARGRQRFKLIETSRDVTGVLTAKVRILSERILPDYLEGARLDSHRKFLCDASEQDEVVKTAVDRKGNVIKSISLLNNRQLNKFSCANYTWWPPWVYKMYCTDFLFQQILKELRSWNDSLNEAEIPKTATELSFWLAQNLPLDDTIRLRLLSYDSPVQRLRYELHVMKMCSVLQCKYCNTAMANKNDVFSMAVEGPMGAYVNPGGHVHETLTIYRAKNLSLIGRSSTEHSWFPGYAWTIAQCKECANHMGWKFTAKNKKLSPEKFWGLCRSSLVPGMQSGEMDKKNQIYR